MPSFFSPAFTTDPPGVPHALVWTSGADSSLRLISRSARATLRA